MNNNNNNKNFDPESAKLLKTIFTWIGIIVCLYAFWPVGLYLIYRQFTKPSVKNSKIFNTFKEGWNSAKNEFRENAASYKATSAHNPSNSASESKPSKNKDSKKLPKARGSVLLLILAIIFIIIGLANIFEAIDSSDMLQGIMGLFNIIGGGAALCARGFINRRARRLTKYITVMGFDDAKSVDEISEITGFSKKLIRKDLNYLAERGYFGDTAYFDIGLDSIVISPEAAENERAIRYAAEKSKSSSGTPSSGSYAATLSNMRRLRGEISDPSISQKVDELIDLTDKIFKIIEEHPEKEPLIKKFNDYYLPSTGKLLRSYSMLEKQGIQGKNIDSAKQDIARILDSLTEGYERQLDKLFDADVLDISSDVDVLETMLKRDGLAGDDFSVPKDTSSQIQMPSN